MSIFSRKGIVRTALILVVALLLCVSSYLVYVIVTYERIADNQALTVDGEASLDTVAIGSEYTVVTQNLGFGAYSRDFTFFMDGGKESRARSTRAQRFVARGRYSSYPKR